MTIIPWYGGGGEQEKKKGAKSFRAYTLPEELKQSKMENDMILSAFYKVHLLFPWIEF